MKLAQFQVHEAFEQTHWWFTARRQIIRALVGAIAPASHESLIIDIGSGTGGIVAALSADYACIGVDRDSTAVAIAQGRHAATKFLNREAPQGVQSELHHAKVVLLLDVLEHIEDDFLFLSGVLAAVQPGTFVLITAPADGDLWSKHDISFGHFRRYDRSRLMATWAGLPASCHMCSYFNSRLYAPIKWIRRINNRLGRTAGKEGTDFAQPPRLINWLLHTIFAGEASVLAGALASGRVSAYDRGVSLAAVLRREEGELRPRTRPCGFEDEVRHEGNSGFVDGRLATNAIIGVVKKCRIR